MGEMNSYDVAAGVLLVEEAGGKVTDFSGKKFTLASKDVVATNSRIHSSILGFLKD
jgi:myo-inositol-1(or 4)-monophosphatase